MSHLLTPLFRGIIRHSTCHVLSARLSIAQQRQRLEWLGSLLPPPLRSRHRQIELGSRPCRQIDGHWTDPNGPVFLYLHGGAYIVGSHNSHRGMLGHLSRAAAATVYSLDYRLAPEHPAPAATEDAVAAYRALLDNGIAPERIIIGGDSAGGGLTLTSTIAIRDGGLPLPAGMLLLSPVADMTFSGSTVDIDDPMLARDWVQLGTDSYTRDIPPEDPRVSPLFADLSGLPPAMLLAGTVEMLLDDARRLKASFDRLGVGCDYQEGDGLWHVWPYFVSSGFGPCRRAIRDIGEWSRETVASQSIPL